MHHPREVAVESGEDFVPVYPEKYSGLPVTC